MGPTTTAKEWSRDGHDSSRRRAGRRRRSPLQSPPFTARSAGSPFTRLQPPETTLLSHRPGHLKQMSPVSILSAADRVATQQTSSASRGMTGIVTAGDEVTKRSGGAGGTRTASNGYHQHTRSVHPYRGRCHASVLGVVTGMKLSRKEAHSASVAAEQTANTHLMRLVVTAADGGGGADAHETSR